MASPEGVRPRLWPGCEGSEGQWEEQGGKAVPFVQITPPTTTRTRPASRAPRLAGQHL